MTHVGSSCSLFNLNNMVILAYYSLCVSSNLLPASVYSYYIIYYSLLNHSSSEADTNAKRHRCSTAPNTSSLNRDCLPAASSSTSDSTDAVPESADSGSYAGTSILPIEKIFIFPRNANMELPSDASVLPCSDEKWVAANLELNRNH